MPDYDKLIETIAGTCQDVAAMGAAQAGAMQSWLTCLQMALQAKEMANYAGKASREAK